MYIICHYIKYKIKGPDLFFLATASDIQGSSLASVFLLVSMVGTVWFILNRCTYVRKSCSIT